MRLDHDPDVHLTYCTNVHPGESWEETVGGVRAHVPSVKSKVSPDRPFGIGLRLSADAARTLSHAANLAEFRDFLARNGLYVFTINGFPYGRFHGTHVKENVYLPDWREEARLDYSNRLADILAALLPEAIEGSVSTVPGAYKARVPDRAAVAQMAGNLVRHAAHLSALADRTGHTIRLALEPEPCCFLETVEETVRFFEDHLFAPPAVSAMARLTGRPDDAALALLRRHLGVCFDVCHAAVEFEEEDALDRLVAAGIAVPKIQLSSALRLPRVGPETRTLLAPYEDGVYLHQVVERGPHGLRRFTDLGDAFETLGEDGPDGREWRVHFHVPVFRDEIGEFATTQNYLKTILARCRQQSPAPHLEVETYTWGVLPERFRQDEPAADIARELKWVMQELAA